VRLAHNLGPGQFLKILVYATILRLSLVFAAVVAELWLWRILELVVIGLGKLPV